MKFCRILWSTQSGRAKACARRTQRILSEQTTLKFLDGIGSSFDECPEPFLDWVTRRRREDEEEEVEDDTFLLMFVSTTGDGEHCDTIRETWERLLSKSLPNNLFEGKRFAMYCLGDRAYGPQFCAAGRKLAIRLLQLGMKTCCEVGYGDDNTPNGGVFRDLDDWLEKNLLPILEKSGTDDRTTSTSTLTPTCPFRCTRAVDTERTGDNSTDFEWEDSKYEKEYRNFFTSSCPVTAYRYDGMTRRILESPETVSFSKQAPMLGTVETNERITASDWEQDTRHIRINLTSTTDKVSSDNILSSLPYQAGDIATILPFNSEELVNKFLAVLPPRIQVMADQPLILEIDESLNNHHGYCYHWPKRFTLRGWLRYCADIHSLPEREDLRALSVYCSREHPMGKEHSEKLRSLSEVSEAALYADYILREKRSWADVLYDFESLTVDSSTLSIETLLMLLPPIRPRDFSIASAPSQKSMRGQGHDFSIELCVAVVQGRTRLGRPYHGLCSEFLSRMTTPEGSSNNSSRPQLLQLWIRPGSFGKLPLDLHIDSISFQTPILCVGAGTGVAPMRSLLLERACRLDLAIKENKTTHPSVDGEPSGTVTNSRNNNILVFGCRKSTTDFYYQEEWAQLSDLGQLRLLTAFSQDQFQKIYVQKVLRDGDDGKLIIQHLLERHGAIYIAGGPKMARAVKEEIMEALTSILPGGDKDAKAFLRRLQRQGKFSVEAWS